MHKSGAMHMGGGTAEVQCVRSRKRWCGDTRAADGGGEVAVQAAYGRGWGGVNDVGRRRNERRRDGMRCDGGRWLCVGGKQ
jgi:hypothetical protein